MSTEFRTRPGKIRPKASNLTLLPPVDGARRGAHEHMDWIVDSVFDQMEADGAHFAGYAVMMWDSALNSTVCTFFDPAHNRIPATLVPDWVRGRLSGEDFARFVENRRKNP